ncbi:hypothetical protein F2Q69_00044162 [Brassica cretica]|uniref:Uncharacterized protein n=1 Tax=Brassica cretica TaxID=69181 RepID=A0A8S9NFQ8_BRACR|nr:hypothetical protein F2Q69_00044162 [Brassica cretica]
MRQDGPSYNLDVALQEHQLIPTVLGVQLNMNYFSATAPQVGLGHAAPSLQRISKQDAYNQASIDVATTQASIAMATSQASAQSHGVNAVTLIQGQWCGQQLTEHSQMQPQPKDNIVQFILAQNTTGQCQSNQPHASWTGQNRQPNQTSEVEVHPNNMLYHQDHFPEQEIDGNRMVAVKKLVEETRAFSSVPHGLFVILI